ncbi:MAG TPA: CRISPR-associated endoribonuclease Cas6 [Thermotogota bacterium]|nr:CRISPR-associated endoribonuclease Cas6 [Thermotogota bacterium]
MRIRITATPKTNDTLLPVSYNYYLQTFIYSLFKEDMPDFHQKGYSFKKRLFKNFTFSRITSPRMHLGLKGWHLGDEICFFISFYDIKAAETALLNLMGVREFRLGSAEFSVSTIKTIFTDEDFPGDSENTQFRFITLSPIVVHRTEEKNDGKKTIYYNPEHEEFYELLASNLKRKAMSVGLTDDEAVCFSPVDVDPEKSLAIVRYKDFMIKGHMGIFNFSGSKGYAKVALEAGIGSKNAQGFGMIRIIPE